MKRISDIVLIVLFAFALYRIVPRVLKSSALEGEQAQMVSVVNLEGEKVMAPFVNERKVYIMWATWCGPCKIQLNQFKNSVEDGSLNKEDIIAISLAENPSTVKAFLKNNPVPYQVLVAPTQTAWQDFKVEATPSIMFVDEHYTIKYFTSGISPLAMTRAKKFLDSSPSQ